MARICLVVLVHAALLALCSLVTETTRAPPVLPNNIQKRLVARDGSKTYTIVCPAEGASPLYVSWTKDGEPITAGWTRFKQVNRERDLRIKNVVSEDAGLYKCHVANGFGSADMEFTLQVVGKNDPLYEYPDSHDEDLDDEHYQPKELKGPTGRAPFWVKSDQIKQLAKQPILKTRGSSVKLKCLATGHPVPDIMWYKDDTKQIDTDRMTSRWVLYITHLKPSDAGKYTCRVVNLFGSLNATFTVGVLDDKPEFEKTLLNASIPEGQTANFQCKVRSSITPTIKWIKMIEAKDYVEDNKTFVYDGKYFRVLEVVPPEPESFPNNTYMKQLKIVNVKPQDAGWYFCVVADTIGNIVNRSANLKVLPVPLPVAADESLPLHITVGVPVALLLILLVGYAIYFLQKHQQKTTNFNNHSRTGSGSSGNSTNAAGANLAGAGGKPPQPPNYPPPCVPSSGQQKGSNAALSPYRRSSPNVPGIVVNNNGYGHMGHNVGPGSVTQPMLQPVAPNGVSVGISPHPSTVVVQQQQYVVKDNYKMYHRLDPMACVPLNGPQQQQQPMGGPSSASVGGGPEEHYEATPQPYELNLEHSEFSDCYDSGVGAGQLQHYPSMYSCR